MKPGSCGPGVLGIYPVIYDEDGNAVEAGSGRAGNICIRNPWPGIFQTIWGDPDRFVQTYYEKYCRDKTSTDWHDWPYFADDGAVQSADGYFRILGRVDDVINVAGHRLGTKELESATMTVDEIAEAAAVPVVGRAARPGGRDVRLAEARVIASEDIEQKVIRAIEDEIGKIARPKNVWIVADMPKTRSGKIMRRVIASISNFTDVGDTTTLANPDDRRGHPPPRPDGEGEPRRYPARAHRTGTEGDRSVRQRVAETRKADDRPRQKGRPSGARSQHDRATPSLPRLPMTQQYIVGEFSSLLAELRPAPSEFLTSALDDLRRRGRGRPACAPSHSRT